MTGLILIVGTIILIAIIASYNSKQKIKQKTDYYSAAKLSLEREEFKRTRNNDLYESLQQQHKHKSREEISQYIELKRSEDDNYWEYHRMEYKILMDRGRVVFENDRRAFIKKLNSVEITDMAYDELNNHYWLVKNNPHIYDEVDLVKLENVLSEKAYNKFLPMLKTQVPTSAKRWLTARKNNGEYIPNSLYEYAIKMEMDESPEVRYKRKRKNIQTAISKAKKNGDKYEIEKLQSILEQLEDDNSYQR